MYTIPLRRALVTDIGPAVSGGRRLRRGAQGRLRPRPATQDIEKVEAGGAGLKAVLVGLHRLGGVLRDRADAHLRQRRGALFSCRHPAAPPPASTFRCRSRSSPSAIWSGLRWASPCWWARGSPGGGAFRTSPRCIRPPAPRRMSRRPRGVTTSVTLARAPSVLPRSGRWALWSSRCCRGLAGAMAASRVRKAGQAHTLPRTEHDIPIGIGGAGVAAVPAARGVALLAFQHDQRPGHPRPGSWRSAA